MARARRHGTWSKVHESIDDHPKTRAAAAVLVEALGLEEDLAAAVITRAVRRLACWGIRESDSGATGHLDDAQVVAIGWPAAMRPGGRLWGAQDVGVLRRALRTVPEGYARGYLYDRGRRQGRKGLEALHEFHAYAWAVLKDRPHYQGTRLEDWLQEPNPPRGPAEDAERSSRGSSEDEGEVEPTSGRNPLQGNGPPRAEDARPPLAIGIGSGSGMDRSGFGGKGPQTPGAILEPLADPADLVRGLRPSHHAGLLEASVYVQRLGQTVELVQGDVPTAYRLAQLSTPGRALEELEPEAFEGLVQALTEKAGTVKSPTAYASTALAKRWAEVIARRTDQAQSRRQRASKARRSG